MARNVIVSLGDTVMVCVGDEGLLLTLEEARSLTWQLVGFVALRDQALEVLVDAARTRVAQRLHALAREFES